jgi:hypothetical protein
VRACGEHPARGHLLRSGWVSPAGSQRPTLGTSELHSSRLLRDLAQDRRLARLGPGARRDAPTLRLPSGVIVWLSHGLRPRRAPREERLERGPGPPTGGSTEPCTSWPWSSSATPPKAAASTSTPRKPPARPRWKPSAPSNDGCPTSSTAGCSPTTNDAKRPGPGGQSGTTLQSGVTDLTPDVGSSDKPLSGPAKPQPKTPLRKAG